jgi:PAS domain-containing protein
MHDFSHKSREELLQEVERLKRDICHLEAAELARRRVQDKLVSECNAFRTAFDLSTVPQLWHDREGRTLRINKAAQALLGVETTPPEFTVFNDPQLILIGVPEYFNRALAGETVRVPKHAFTPSKTHTGAPGEKLMMASVMYPVLSPSGEVTSVVTQLFNLKALAGEDED